MEALVDARFVFEAISRNEYGGKTRASILGARRWCPRLMEGSDNQTARWVTRTARARNGGDSDWEKRPFIAPRL